MNHRLQLLGTFGPEAREGRGGLIQNLGNQLRQGLCREGRPRCQKLIGCRSEAKDLTAFVRCHAGEYFRQNVARGGVCGSSDLQLDPRTGQLGDTEVTELDLLACTDSNHLRADLAVQDTLLVGVLQSLAELQKIEELDDIFDRLVRVDPRLQRSPWKDLLHQVGLRLARTEFQHSRDVVMA